MDTVELFFSCDENYLPLLAVTLTSIREHRDPQREYSIRVLHTGLRESLRTRMQLRFCDDGFTVRFVDISEEVARVAQQLHTRDHYTKTTYYRLFIPELFPQLEKVLYLDCDIVLQTDVAELFDQDMAGDLVGAVPDSMVTAIDAFGEYVSNRLGIRPEHYFNAGVLLMDLDAMRRFHFTEVFLKLLNSVTFRVAQDQDYLNVICKGRTLLLGREWNTMPGCAGGEPKLIHYNLDCKPWWRDDVPYGDVFWDYARRSGYFNQVKAIRSGFTREKIARAAAQTRALVALGQRQARRRLRNQYLGWKIRKVVAL